MKVIIVILTLLVGSYVNGQDTALFNQIDSIIATVDFTVSKGTSDTLKSSFLNDSGTTSDIVILKQGRVVQKIYVITNPTNARVNITFHNGKPICWQISQGNTSWKYYLVGEKQYLYFKDDNKLITLTGRYYNDRIHHYLSLFKDQVDDNDN